MEFLDKAGFKIASINFFDNYTCKKKDVFETPDLPWLWIFANSLDFYKLQWKIVALPHS